MGFPYRLKFRFGTGRKGQTEGPYQAFHYQNNPPWFRQPKGRAFWRALGGLKDEVLDRTREAVLARFPRQAASDAVVQIGIERGIEPGMNESTASYAERLVGAWDTWRYAGTATGILNALYYAGYTEVELISQKGRHLRRNASTGIAEEVFVNPDGYYLSASNFWNTFIVFFYGALPAQWGGVVPASNSNEAERMRRLIRKWKSAHAICAGISIANGGPVWGIDRHEWGDGTLWGSTAVFWTF